MIKTSCFFLLETELALKLDSGFKGRASPPSYNFEELPLREANARIEGSYFGWVCRPRIHSIWQACFTCLFSGYIYCSLGFQRIYEMHACSSIEKEEQWKFVDQIFVIRHVLATRSLLPGAPLLAGFWMWSLDLARLPPSTTTMLQVSAHDRRSS